MLYILSSRSVTDGVYNSLIFVENKLTLIGQLTQLATVSVPYTQVILLRVLHL